MTQEAVLSIECGCLKFAMILNEVVKDMPKKLTLSYKFLYDTIKVPKGVLIPRAFLLGNLIYNLKAESPINTSYYYKVPARGQIYIDIKSLLLLRNVSKNLSITKEARKVLCV